MYDLNEGARNTYGITRKLLGNPPLKRPKRMEG
jgi:hypothetical protein